MSSDRPYQSQLFTVLNRTVQRAKDQAGLLWRNLKVAVTWGAQLSLYPFYAVVKASRIAGKQLGQTWRSQQFHLPAWMTGEQEDSLPTPDAPIHTILTALTTRQIAALPAGDADCLMIALAEGTQIQGVASMLSTRRLAIVTTTNQTLDILSGPQQHELRQRIIYEIASYWRTIRSRRLPSKASPLLQGLRDRLSIARLSGFQSSIGALNPMGQMGQVGQVGQISHPIAPVQIPTLWSDRPLPTHSASPFPVPAFSELPDLIKAALQYFFGGSVTRGSLDGRHPTALGGQPTIGMAPGMDRLPAAAINLQANLQVNLQATPIAIADPWSLIPEFQPGPQIVANVQPMAKPPGTGIALPQAPTLPSLTTVKNWVQARLAANMQGTQLTPRAPKQSAVRGAIAIPNRAVSLRATAPASTTRQPASAAKAISQSVSNLPTRSTSTRVAHAPDWLEARTTPMGYQVSWLERLVLGLDRAIVFLEQIFLTFWNWLQVLRKTR